MPMGRREALAALPNLREITDPLEAIREISWSKPCLDHHDFRTLLPPKNPNYPNRHPTYVKLYLKSTPMGGGWDGRGVLISDDYPQPRVFTFALCKHEKTEEGHNPRPGRGWHPGHCKLCNMDMTVDSGD
jgi:hypothetical protein